MIVRMSDGSIHGDITYSGVDFKVFNSILNRAEPQRLLAKLKWPAQHACPPDEEKKELQCVDSLACLWCRCVDKCGLLVEDDVCLCGDKIADHCPRHDGDH